MPTYCYVCDECGQPIEIIKPMAKINRTEHCDCGAKLRRDRGSESVNTTNHDYSTPHVSHSLAITPSQIADHKKRFPDVDVREDGCLVFHDYKTHDSYLKKRGMVKQPQKVRRRVSS